MRAHGRQLDDVAQRILAVQSDTDSVASVARNHLGTIGSDLSDALSMFGRLWARQAELVAISAANLSMVELGIAHAVQQTDADDASGFGAEHKSTTTGSPRS